MPPDAFDNDPGVRQTAQQPTSVSRVGSSADMTSLSELLLRWEHERAQGKEMSAEELCGDDPALRPEVERRIAALRAVYQALDGEPTLLNDRPASHTDLPTVPGYEVLGVLGRGGMGVVYQARHLKLNRLVALKMIGHGGRVPRDERERFRREAEAIARLEHPNIVQIIEVGQQESLPYLALEYCPGGSLAHKLNGTPLSPRRAARLVEALARAMQAAHEQHIIHRDLKPANVLLRHDGTPTITDFGLAKQLDLSQGLTPTLLVMGTPSYMAPEQASGQTRHVGPAADIYALGAILYECLSGRPPFRAVTPADTVLQVLHHEPVPPSLLQPGLPHAVEAICLHCLEKQPARRYPNAQALADDLARFSAGQSVSARGRGKLLRWWRRLRG